MVDPQNLHSSLDLRYLSEEFLRLLKTLNFQEKQIEEIHQVFCIVFKNAPPFSKLFKSEQLSKETSSIAGRDFARQISEMGFDFEQVYSIGKHVQNTFANVLKNPAKDIQHESDFTPENILEFIPNFNDSFFISLTKEWLRLEILPYHKKIREANRFILHEKRRYFTIFNRMADPAFIVDQNLRLIETNKAFNNMFGLSGNKHIGEPCYNIIGAEADSARSLEELLYDNDVPSVETQLTINGHVKNVIISGTFLGEINSEYSGGIIIITDITEKKEADKALLVSEEKYRSLIENVPDVTWRADQYGNVSFMSPNVENICGYSFDEISKWEQQSWLNRVHPDDVDMIRNEYSLFFASHMPEGVFLRDLLRKSSDLIDENFDDGKKKYDVKYRFQKKDGSWIWLHDRAISIYQKDGECYTDGIFRDISDLKKAEEEIDRHHFRLAEMVDEQTAELSAANHHLKREIKIRKQAEADLLKLAKKLKKSNEELEQFAHVASHDLKEPLMLIIAFSQRLVKKHGENLDSKGKEYLSRIIRAADLMFKFVEGLLELSRVSASSNPFIETDLSELVRDVVQNLEERIKETKGDIQFSNLGKLVCDEVQVRQLFQNIFTNSLKYRKDDSPPKIEVTSRISGENFCEIRVSDNGIGFEQQYVERIFKPLERLHARKDFDGTGIGLATCQKIVARHGGEITAQSKPGQGTTFIVRFPTKFDNL